MCLPHAGGAASFFFPMSRSLAPAVDVISLQYPGRQDRMDDPMIESVGEYADVIAAELRPWLDVPTAFFGHSMGALLAFEVTRRLERDTGFSPVAIYASGRRAPSRQRDERVHLRDDDGMVREMKQLNGTDTQLFGDREVLRMVMPSIRNDYKAVETYRAEPGAAVRAPITVLTGDSDPRTTPDEAEAWRAHTTGAFDLHVFAGGHFFLANHQEQINRIVSGGLTTAGASGS
ncbi:thioesterase II family protein [Streptomyces sp. NPDC088725]|uniref:thioesterase II family protein n=1 Tax=Streptomyces sp. NPDC088725 TaxID=3365873 RepID=UPI003805FCF0